MSVWTYLPYCIALHFNGAWYTVGLLLRGQVPRSLLYGGRYPIASPSHWRLDVTINPFTKSLARQNTKLQSTNMERIERQSMMMMTRRPKLWYLPVPGQERSFGVPCEFEFVSRRIQQRGIHGDRRSDWELGDQFCYCGKKPSKNGGTDLLRV